MNALQLQDVIEHFSCKNPSMSLLKSRFGRLFEAAVLLLEFALRFGLISGTAVAAALGQFILAGVLGVLAVGAFLRFKRGRVLRKK